jgi:hypothetical protein
MERTNTPPLGDPEGQPETAEPTTVPVTTTSTPKKLKRGRPANPNPAPRGYRKRLMEEIEADMLAKLDAEKAAKAAAEAAPGYTPPPPTPPTRWNMRPHRAPPVPPGPILSTYQQRRRRTEELKDKREDEARCGAGLLRLAQELKARREAQEKAAAERKAKGIKLTYEEWKREEWGE